MGMAWHWGRSWHICFFMLAWQHRLGFLGYCSEDQVNSPCGGESSSKGAYGLDDNCYKKSATNVENGTVKGDPSPVLYYGSRAIW